jgi:uncharacterized membrane protein (Fun14 family)
VVEVGILPAEGTCPVTGDAVDRETQELVVRVGGGIVIGEVTAHAIRWKSFVESVFMAFGTERRFVLTQKRECSVIEFHSLPPLRRGPVTGDAVGRETQELVVRVGGGIVIGEVTAHAIRWKPFVDASCMAAGTAGLPVAAQNGKKGMVKCRSLPRDIKRAVAGGAVGRKSGSAVIRINGIRVFG